MAIDEIIVLATGGTIAMGERLPGSGAVPALTGSDLLRNLPPLPYPHIQVSVDNFCNVPSAHFSLEDLWKIADRMRFHAAQRDCGFVVTMGTDILEEAAYFVHLTAGHLGPSVMTGAMRSANQLGYEGYANLYHSLIAAAAPELAETGTVVVLNEEIHAAREVQKTHSTNMATFSSPGWGPLGWIVENQARVRRVPVGREAIPARPPFPRVELIRFAAGMDSFLLDKAVESGVAGLVVEASGVGHVSPAIADAMERAVRANIPVVVTSRCFTGSVLTKTYAFTGSESDLAKRGAIMSRGLTGLKARIKLICSLAAGDDLETVRERFETD
jgi:L-asparaginase